jgi:SET domain-containing protein
MPDRAFTEELEVRKIEGKGRGVFARIPFAKGTTIEVCPIILIPAEQWHHIEPTVFALYIYNFGPQGEHAAIPLGYGSLYNHSYKPCAMYVKVWEDLEIHFVAVRDIEPGEEITVNYNGRPEDQTRIWFETID